MTGEYDDIMAHERFEPKNHPRMPLGSRAAQFAPFAALSGFGEAIERRRQRYESSLEKPSADDEPQLQDPDYPGPGFPEGE